MMKRRKRIPMTKPPTTSRRTLSSFFSPRLKGIEPSLRQRKKYSTRKMGRIVILGGFRRPITLHWLRPLLKEQTIVFSSCYSIVDSYHDFEIAIDLLSSGRVPLPQIVTHTYPLDAIQQGFETAYDKSSGSIKVQIHQ